MYIRGAGMNKITAWAFAYSMAVLLLLPLAVLAEPICSEVK